MELHAGKFNTPRKALPELARIADRYPGTRVATWVENTLRQLRADLWTDVQRGPADEDRTPDGRR